MTFDIWHKYSKYSRIEFVCFRFRVRLLVVTLSSLKLVSSRFAETRFAEIRV